MRHQQIEDSRTELNHRADRLQEHLQHQKQEAAQKFDNFVQEVLTTDHFNYLMEANSILEFEKLF